MSGKHKAQQVPEQYVMSGMQRGGMQSEGRKSERGQKESRQKEGRQREVIGEGMITKGVPWQQMLHHSRAGREMAAERITGII